MIDDRFETAVAFNLYDVPRLNQFMIREAFEDRAKLKQEAMGIMRTLSDNLFSVYEIHGYGRAACKGVDRLTELLNTWIMVVHIETGLLHGAHHIVVYFKRAVGFHKAHKKAKKIAEKVGPTRRILAQYGYN